MFWWSDKNRESPFFPFLLLNTDLLGLYSARDCPAAAVQTEALAQEHAVNLRGTCSPVDADSDGEDEHPVPIAHQVSKYEAAAYYIGLNIRGQVPKLVYRTSSDAFFEPNQHGGRRMELAHVDEDHELGKDGLWDVVRDLIVLLLDSKAIKHSSLDLVCFTWVNENHSVTEPVGYGARYTTPPTVWIGVLPNTLSADLAYEAALEILEILKQHNISGVDVAFRESVVKFSRGPALYGPPDGDHDPLYQVVDNVSTPLSLPISTLGAKTQGTLGFYFKVGNDLFAVTARHVLFDHDEGNDEYRHVGTFVLKEVVVMEGPAFDNYCASIHAHIRDLYCTVASCEKRAVHHKKAKAEAKDGSPEALDSAQSLKSIECEMTTARANIVTLNGFYQNIREHWRNPEDRIIGYVHWAPSINTAVSPHRYMRDFCVIKLDKKKFKNYAGNVVSLALGTTLSESNDKFRSGLYDRVEVPSEFWYPFDGLLHLRGILTAADINNPRSKNIDQSFVPRRVLKRGSATGTTFGTLSKYMSHNRKYNISGYIDSIEAAILPRRYNKSYPALFSKEGDSGSLVVDAHRRLVALITSGTGNTESSGITYATPVEYIWAVIKDEYEGASLDLEDSVNVVAV
ncbi:hypothetical protein BC835DRAFT_1298724 [Cytidiella melzeri]|nr:hypothetical protein BC835DRAFT_1298724 [Cytidiella melzeri]